MILRTLIHGKLRNEYCQQDVQKGIPARPQRAKGRGVRGWYVEALSDARTTLEGFCNILGLTFPGVLGDIAGGFGEANCGIGPNVGDDFFELFAALIGQ